nr:MAG TPA: hypothetical protein [Caudoviricetes sp.]
MLQVDLLLVLFTLLMANLMVIFLVIKKVHVY